MNCAPQCRYQSSILLVMEQAQPGEAHDHVVLVAGLNHVVVSDRATRLCDVADARLVGALDIVAEGEEGVGTQSHTGVLSDPSAFFFRGERAERDGTGNIRCSVPILSA